MHDFVKAMTTLQQRFTSRNSVGVDRVTIQLDEFEAIVAEIRRLQSVCHDQMNGISDLHKKLSQVPDKL